ncbi:MAG: hypothetical protein OXU70_01565 [Gammaproteobacteria bacterium]|nr:hypothetical protein [Gammaproteobacteria bacterium]
MEDKKFHRVGFHPWIGERYSGDNRFDVRVLVLGESHYDKKGNEGPAYTKEVVRRATQLPRTGKGRRQRFFTVAANVLRGKPGRIDNRDLAAVFQEIAFYNFIQTFAGDGPRGKPTFRQWVDAQEPLKIVLDALRPHAVLVLGLELGNHILDWPAHIERTVTAHPASSRLRYDDAIPAFRDLIERAKQRVSQDA